MGFFFFFNLERYPELESNVVLKMVQISLIGLRTNAINKYELWDSTN